MRPMSASLDNRSLVKYTQSLVFVLGLFKLAAFKVSIDTKVTHWPCPRSSQALTWVGRYCKGGSHLQELAAAAFQRQTVRRAANQ